MPGTYIITAFDNESIEYYEPTGTLEVLNCSNSGIGMPSTGLPTGALALAGASLLTFVGIVFGIRKLGSLS